MPRRTTRMETVPKQSRKNSPNRGSHIPQKVLTVHPLLIALATSPAPAPSPSLRPGLSQDQVTPGLLGFLLTAFIVLLTALLIVDMVRRIRRVRYRAQVEEERAAAAEAALHRDAPASPAAGDPEAANRNPDHGAGTRPEVNGDAGSGNR
ncbi:MAG: hypothetical protein JWM01_2032 [Arthrobacter sp.]|jgi:hypothetical protein|nr:hypothetical protein [Arthrobacter sp.]MCU1521868.1 hypothetical protein [Arthrobacter sp.]MCU1541085.1 hypothetical protein [Arthrobacter sp.]